jgi:hypothetical protein
VLSREEKDLCALRDCRNRSIVSIMPIESISHHILASLIPSAAGVVCKKVCLVFFDLLMNGFGAVVVERSAKISCWQSGWFRNKPQKIPRESSVLRAYQVSPRVERFSKPGPDESSQSQKYVGKNKNIISVERRIGRTDEASDKQKNTVGDQSRF